MNKLADESWIKMPGKRIDFIESCGRNYFAMLYRGDDIPSYCETVLTNGICEKLLPMRFIRTYEGLYLHYEYGGFVQLKDVFRHWRQEGKNISIEMIEILISILKCINAIENHLFKTSGYSLITDTVFVNPETAMVKMAYVPEETDSLLSQSFILLMEELRILAEDDQWNHYAKEIAEKTLLSGDSLMIIERKLVKKAREIISREWPAKEMLRIQTP